MDVTKLVDMLIGLLPENIQQQVREGRKAVVAFLGTLLMALTTIESKFGFLIPAQFRGPLKVIIAIATAVSTWLVPNAPPEPAVQPAGP